VAVKSKVSIFTDEGPAVAANFAVTTPVFAALVAGIDVPATVKKFAAMPWNL